jgi:hypothetical protein
MRRAARAVAAVAPFAAAALILISPGATRAQSPAQTREARRVEMETRQRDLWNLERAKRRPAERDERPLYRQVSEDFEKLQLSSYNLSGAIASTAALDYELIRAEAAEIRKRAARLVTTLKLPAPEKERKQKKGEPPAAAVVAAAVAPDLKSAIVALESVVKSFVWNPVFQQSGVVDVQNSARAGRDLEDIIKLSEQVRKSAEAAGKSGGRN